MPFCRESLNWFWSQCRRSNGIHAVFPAEVQICIVDALSDELTVWKKKTVFLRLKNIFQWTLDIVCLLNTHTQVSCKMWRGLNTITDDFSNFTRSTQGQNTVLINNFENVKEHGEENALRNAFKFDLTGCGHFFNQWFTISIFDHRRYTIFSVQLRGIGDEFAVKIDLIIWINVRIDVINCAVIRIHNWCFSSTGRYRSGELDRHNCVRICRSKFCSSIDFIEMINISFVFDVLVMMKSLKEKLPIFWP